MNEWVAIVPLKPRGERKTRLRAHLAADERDRLAELLADHVMRILSETPRIRTRVVLAAERPSIPHDRWIADRGRGLNVELAEARRSMMPAASLIIHADLPGLCVADVETMIDLAEQQGSAVAPDRHMTGTNALALAHDRPFDFAFGAGSFAKHRTRLGCECGVASRPGLALDLDTPADLKFTLDILRHERRASSIWTGEASAHYVRALASPEA
jgi:2-phospho-L-lactate guanylyltransferase